MHRASHHRHTNLLLASLLAGSIFTSIGFAQAQPSSAPPAESQSARPVPPPSGNWHAREGSLYRRNWGVDIIGVRRASAGEMLVFRYRILDVAKAQPLNDKRKPAYLIDEKTGTKISVPQMEKVGLLRTTTAPKLNRDYWMVFPNPGNLVQTGSRVSVVIGDFRVDGLVVDSR